MSLDKDAALRCSLPEGYHAVPLHDPGRAPVRLCFLVQKRPDPVTGPLVLLRDLPDTRVYLGCLTDSAGRLLSWWELWIQNLDGLDRSSSAVVQNLSNRVMDQRWLRQAKLMQTLNADGCLVTGWESAHPLPLFLDPASQGWADLSEGDPAKAWMLCEDDAALVRAGLPPYSTSLCRFLYQPAAGEDTKFVVTTAVTTESRSVRALPDFLGTPPKFPVNAQGGLLMATQYAPIPYVDYADLLGGKPWPGLNVGKSILRLGGVYESLGDWGEIRQRGAHLLLGRQGTAGILVETFHLKLQLFAEAVSQVRTAVACQELPFLNLGADSFGVTLESQRSKLPVFWSARASLRKPTQAIALPVESTEFTYFVRTADLGPTVYLPGTASQVVRGQGNVRIRQLLPGTDGRFRVEGTLVVPDGLDVSPRDLLRLSLPLSTGRIDVQGHVYTEEGLAPGEVRFRTFAHPFAEATVKGLTGLAGVSLPSAPFEVVPLLSTPCDLYSLGVLGVRTLLVDDRNTLAMAVDELLSLARQASTEPDPTLPLPDRVAAIFRREPRYTASLGPDRLMRDSLDPAQAAALFPAELWFTTLATLIRFFPGLGPDSVCRDFGDAPALALETVFNRPLQDLEDLLVRSRSLLVIDWHQNREIAQVIRRQRTEP